MSENEYKKGAKINVSKHFVSSEFDCPCNACTVTLVQPDLVSKLENLRVAINQPLKISSGYRCESYQLELKLRGFETAKGISQHQLGAAADLLCEGMTGESLEHFARQAGFTSVGVGHSFIHVDLRPGNRRWTYAKR